MAQTLLTYAINPTSVPATQESGTDNKRTFVITATNPNQTAVTLTRLSITLPIGLNAPDLSPAAPNLPSITPNPQPTEWNTPSKTTSTGHVTYTFDPTSNFPHGVQVGSRALMITFEDIAITSEVGTADIVITEGSPNSPTTTLTVSKFPNVWSQTSFTVITPIAYDSTPTLRWEGGPADATYYLTYWTAQTGAVRYPKTGSLGSSGTYPGTGPNAPKLKLTADTVFNLWVSKQMAPNSPPVVMQLQKTVVVEPPPPPLKPLPKITLFTGKIETVGTTITVVLTWQTEHTTKCTISNISELFEPSGSTTITPSASDPLKSIYTLTASNSEGDTANSIITMEWHSTDTIDATAISAVISPDGTQLYATQPKTRTKPGTMTVIDTSAVPMRVVAGPVDTEAPSPWSTVITHGGSRIFIGSYDDYSRLSVIDTTTTPPTLVQSTKIGGGVPIGVGVSPDGTRLLVTSYEENQILVYDTSSLPMKVIQHLPVGKNPTQVAFSPDGSYAFIANYKGASISVIDATATPMKVVQTIKVDPGPGYSVVSPDGSRVFLAHSYSLGRRISIIDTKATPMTVLQTIDVGDDPVGLAVSPDGSRVFVAVSNTIKVINTTTSPMTMVQTMQVHGQPQFVTTSPDGVRIFVTRMAPWPDAEFLDILVIGPPSVAGGTGS